MSSRVERASLADDAEHAWQLRHRDSAEAGRVAAEVAATAARDGDRPKAIRAATVQAAIAFADQDYERASALVQATLPSAEEDLWRGRLLLVLANVFAEVGEPDHAADLFNQAVTVAERVGDTQLVAQCLLNAALDQVDAGDQLRDFRRALAVFRRIADREGEAYALLDLAHALADVGRLHEALADARRAGAAAEEAGVADVLVHARVLEAQLAARLGHRLHAETLLGEATRLTASARPALQVDVTVEAARAWSALGDVHHVVAVLEPLAGETALSDRQKIALTDLLSAAYAARGDHESAYWTLRSHLATRDGHEDAMARRRAAALAVLHRVRSVEQEAARIRERSIALDHALTELRSEHEVVTEISQRDDLTGLHNRRHLDERLRAELEHATVHHPVSMLLLDLDHFKAVNDTYGHLVGDQVLKEVGRVLGAQVRATDLAARYGGEELAVVQPATDLPAARALGERLRDRISGIDWRETVGAPLDLTVSIGAATATGAETPRDLVRRADGALYEAKAAGRDRVVTAPAIP